MSRLNHSPGPWKVFPLPEASVIHIETSSGHVVCEVHTYPRQRAPKANAHFISAAPDMFEVLTTLSQLLEADTIGEKVYKKMMDALSKAKGEGLI